VSAIVFLALNGYDFEAPEDDLVEMVYGVARNEVEKMDVAVFMRRWVRKR
jgi:death-on-curing protein